jgi:DNA-binding transcriptional regulator/RsmH inhibitor MraZ
MDDLNEQLISIGIGCNRDKTKFHLYAIGKSNIKTFFTGEGFSEDINERVETDDFVHAFMEMQEIVNDEDGRIMIADSIRENK